MHNKFTRLTLLLCFVSLAASAQYRYRGRMYTGRSPQQQRRSAQQPIRQRAVNTYKPTFNLSLGYGFPNLDKNNMLEFYNYSPGHTSFQGPYMITAEYQFSRTAAVGIMATYGKVNREYYYNNDVLPAFNGKLENTSVLLNFTRYMPATKTVTPYLRTAIGLNFPNSSYTSSTGASIARDADDYSLAYQASLGVKLNFTERAGLFAEAGYGKYIVAGGLSFKF